MNFRRLVLSVLTVAALVAPAAVAGTVLSQAAAPGGAAGTTRVISLDSGGLTRSYRLFVPTTLPPGPRPLLLSMHGFNLDAASQESGSGLDKTAGKAGALVAYPDGLGHSWNAGTCCGTAATSKVDDVGFLTDVITDVASRYSVDRLRIAASGFSNGGMMSYRLGCERTELVDTIVVMSGAYVAPACPMAKPLNVLHMHGLLDATVPYNGGIIPVTGTKVRAAYGPIGAIAQLDGCTSFSVVPSASALVITTQGQGCPAGVQVSLVTSSTLKHTWPTGTSAIPTYGFDATSNLWGFLAIGWANRGAPVPL